MAGGGAMGGAPTATVGNPQAQGGMGGGMPQQAPQQMAMSPLVQQQIMRQQAPQQMYNPQQVQPQQMGGLQAALMQMLGQYNQPMARPQIQQMQQMPQYQNRALQYRPNTLAAQQNLNRVKPSVQKQAEDAQAARIKELEDKLASFTSPSYDTYYNQGGG